MIANYNRKSLVIGIPGLILQGISYLAEQGVANPATPHSEWIHLPLLLLFLAGTAMLIWGLRYYAKAKGQPTALCLLGLLGLLGLIVLAMLRDNTKQGDPVTNDESHPPADRNG
jgi:peptidoglycan/LPS O-acetylase OafA/YrhL